MTTGFSIFPKQLQQQNHEDPDWTEFINTITLYPVDEVWEDWSKALHKARLYWLIDHAPQLFASVVMTFYFIVLNLVEEPDFDNSLLEILYSIAVVVACTNGNITTNLFPLPVVKTTQHMLKSLRQNDNGLLLAAKLIALLFYDLLSIILAIIPALVFSKGLLVLPTIFIFIGMLFRGFQFSNAMRGRPAAYLEFTKRDTCIKKLGASCAAVIGIVLAGSVGWETGKPSPYCNMTAGNNLPTNETFLNILKHTLPEHCSYFDLTLDALHSHTPTDFKLAFMILNTLLYGFNFGLLIARCMAYVLEKIEELRKEHSSPYVVKFLVVAVLAGGQLSLSSAANAATAATRAGWLVSFLDVGTALINAKSTLTLTGNELDLFIKALRECYNKCCKPENPQDPDSTNTTPLIETTLNPLLLKDKSNSNSKGCSSCCSWFWSRVKSCWDSCSQAEYTS